MVVRKFEAANLEAALKLVKEAFGPDALILSTQEKKRGWFHKPTLEVTAAQPEAVKAEAPRQTLTEAALQKIFPHRRYTDEGESTSDRDRPVSRPSRETSNAQPKGATARLKVSANYQEHEGFFLRRGFSAAHAKEFALRLTSDYPMDELRKPARADALRARLLAPAIRTLGEDVFEMRRSWAAIGAPGSGKTALLVKLGLHLRSRGFRVQLASNDRRKLLAQEEVRGYARLLGDTQRAETIDLLDTSAYRWNDPASIDLLKPACRDRSVLLVLDATMRSAEMLRAIESVVALAPQAVAFSRLDLVCHPGAIYEVLRQAGIPVLVGSCDLRLQESLRFYDPYTFSQYLIQEPERGGN